MIAKNLHFSTIYPLFTVCSLPYRGVGGGLSFSPFFTPYSNKFRTPISFLFHQKVMLRNRQFFCINIQYTKGGRLKTGSTCAQVPPTVCTRPAEFLQT